MIKFDRIKDLVPAMAAVSAHGLRMGVNLVIIKMIAVFVGPAGMGVLGHFMSLTTFVNVFSGGGIGSAVTKYVAEYRGRPRDMLRFIGAASVYGLLFSAVVLVVCVAAATPLSEAIFGRADYAWLIVCLGVTHLFSFIGTLVVSVVNGLRRSDLFAAITSVGYLSALPVAYVLVSRFSVTGAALALMFVSSCFAIPAFFLIKRSRLTKLVKLSIDRVTARRLANFGLMIFISAIVVPASEIVVRTLIAEKLGYAAAGYWQAITRLSVAYSGFFTMLLVTDYMPKLSAFTKRGDRVGLVKKYLGRVAAAFLIFAVILYASRGFVIRVVFSSEFDVLGDFIVYQLVGDFFRVCSYTIGFLTVAMAQTRLYVAGELIQMGLYVFVSWVVLIRGDDLAGLIQGYALTYFIYFCLVFVVFVIYSRKSE